MQDYIQTLRDQLRKVEPHNWLIVILLLAVVMRLPHLDGSLWLDEAAQALESRRPLAEQLQIRDDFQPPLIHLLVHGLLQISEHEAWIRLGAAYIPGVITVMVLVQIGRRYLTPYTGWISGVLLATASFHIFYSQELRPYSLPAMFAILGWWTLLEVTREKKIRREVPGELFRFGVWSVLGLYSSYLYPFALFGQLTYVAWKWRNQLQRLPGLLITVSAICIAFAPWIPSFLDQLQAGQQLRQSFPGWESVVSFDQLKSIGLVVGKFIFGVLDLSAHPVYVVVTGIIFAASLCLLFQFRKATLVQKMLPIFICWVVLPIVTAWLISFVVPVVQPKRVLFALPGLYLFWSGLIVVGLRQYKTWSTVGVFLLTVLLGTNLFSSLSYYTQSKYQRENWREVHRYIEEKYGQSNSIVFFAFTNEFASWAWYNTTDFPTASTQAFVVSDDPLSPDRQQIKKLNDYQYVLVFDYLRDLSDPQHYIEKDLERFGFQQVDVIQGSEQLGNIRVFAKTRQIIGYSEY